MRKRLCKPDGTHNAEGMLVAEDLRLQIRQLIESHPCHDLRDLQSMILEQLSLEIYTAILLDISRKATP